jgi:hypothetical protein
MEYKVWDIVNIKMPIWDAYDKKIYAYITWTICHINKNLFHISWDDKLYHIKRIDWLENNISIYDVIW